MNTKPLSISRDAVHDLMVCARHLMPQLNAKALVAVAAAVAEAEAELERAKAKESAAPAPEKPAEA